MIFTIGIAQAQNPQPGAAGSDFEKYPLLGNGGYDIHHMDLSLDWEAEANILSGVISLEAIAIHDLSSFNLDFVGYEISLLQVNEVDTSYHREDYELVITPSEYIPEDEQFAVLIHYSGTPGSIPDPNASGNTYDATYGLAVDENSLAMKWGPYGRSSLYPTSDDSSSFNVQITVPNPMVAVTNNSLLDVIDNGITSMFIWESNTESYFSHLMIGLYEEDSFVTDSGIEITVYTLEGTPELTLRYNRIQDMLALLSDAFGDYHSDELTIINAQDIGARAYANDGIIVLTSFGLSDGILMHELAHLWFGVKARMNSSEDRWLIEGTATYTEILWSLQQVYYDDLTRFDSSLPTILALNWDNVYNLDPIAVPSEPFDQASYDRGAFTLLMLQNKVGSETFFEIMRMAVEDNDDGILTTEKFVTLAEEISGQELSEFFDLLFYSEPLPTLEEFGVE